MRKSRRHRSSKLRRQSPVPGGRTVMSAGFVRAIEEQIEQAMMEYNVSRSFVIAVAVAKFFGIRHEDYL